MTIFVRINNTALPLHIKNCNHPLNSCTDQRKDYCWYSFQSCKYECPCGDKPIISANDIADKTDLHESRTETTCINGCPCSDTAHKIEYCEEMPEFGRFSILGNDTRTLDMTYGIYPNLSAITVDWRNIDDHDDVLRLVSNEFR